MYTKIIAFLLKNFTWIAPVGKAIKSFFSPLAIVVLVIVALLVSSNYYFYKKTKTQGQILQSKEKMLKDLNTSTQDLREQYLAEINSKNAVEQKYKQILKTIEKSNKKKLKRSKEYAKKIQQTKRLKANPLSPAVSDAFCRMHEKDYSTKTENNLSR